MASQWFCRIGEQEYGPYSSSELKQLCQEHRLLPENQVRQGEQGRWVNANQVSGLFAAQQIKQAAPMAAAAARPAAPRFPGGQQPVAVAPVNVTPVNVVPNFAAGSVPMGLQVGGAPMGMPVGVAPVSPQFADFAPAGTPVAQSAARAAYNEDDDEDDGPKKDQTALYITVGLAAGVVLLAGLGAAIGLGAFSSKPQKREVVAADPEEEDKSSAEVDVDPESTPAKNSSASTDSKNRKNENAKGPAKPDDSSKAAEAGKPSKAQQKILGEVLSNKGWRDTSTVKAITYGNLKMSIVGAWFSGSTAASPSSPSPAVSDEETAGNASRGASEGTAQPAAAGKPKYVCVEVSLTNTKGPGIVSYKSWNGAGKKPEVTAAVLVDSEGRVCNLVGREQAPEAGRRQTEELAVGQSITDVLVFEAPTGDFDFLRVALPYAAIGRTSALGFQIPRDHIALDKQALAVKSPATPAVGGAVGKPGGKQPESIEGVINVAPPKKPANRDEPENIKDIIKRANEDMKKKEAEEKAAGQKAGDAKPAEKP